MDVQKSKREQQKEKYKQLLNRRYQEDLQQLESRYQMKLDGVERMRARIEQEKLSRELEYKNRFENITRAADGAGLPHNHRTVGQLDQGVPGRPRPGVGGGLRGGDPLRRRRGFGLPNEDDEF